MNCAVIGAGFGAQHAAWLSRIPGVRLGGLAYARDAARAEHVRSQFGFGTVSENAEAMIATGGFDLVAIVSPPATHLPLVAQSVAAGAAIVVDKPLAEYLASAEEITRIAASTKRSVYVFFQWRLLPAFRDLRLRIASGEFGPLSYVSGEFRHDFLAANSSHWSWRHAANVGGAGALSDLGVHVLDLLRFVSGSDWDVRDAEVGLAHPSRRIGGRSIECEADDFAEIRLVRPRDSCSASVSVSRVAVGSRELAFRVVGRDGAVSIVVSVDAGTGRLVTITRDGGRAEEAFTIEDFNPYEPLIAALRADQTSASLEPASAHDGLAAQKLMTDALRIAASRHAN